MKKVSMKGLIGRMNGFKAAVLVLPLLVGVSTAQVVDPPVGCPDCICNCHVTTSPSWVYCRDPVADTCPACPACETSVMTFMQNHKYPFFANCFDADMNADGMVSAIDISSCNNPDITAPELQEECVVRVLYWIGSNCNALL